MGYLHSAVTKTCLSAYSNAGEVGREGLQVPGQAAEGRGGEVQRPQEDGQRAGGSNPQAQVEGLSYFSL